MTEEIKEILDNLKINETTGMCYLSIRLTNQIRSIITNLQQENERLNNIINTFEEDLEREVNISEQDSMVGNYRYTVIHSTLEKMLKYFKELKERDNNERII